MNVLSALHTSLSLLLCCGALAPAMAATTFKVGTGPGCTHASIQAAIDASAADGQQDSTIIVSRSLSYTQQALSIRDDYSLRILGGFANCNDVAPIGGAYTRIDGSGGVQQPVISTRGYVELTLDGIEISGGDAGNDQDGGGIDFAAEGRLAISRSAIHDNRAGDGGGIAIRSARSTLVLGDGALVYNNFAANSGGGIFCIYGNLNIGGVQSGAFNNRTHGEGGGLRLKNCDTELTSSGPLDAGVVFGNQGYRAGGLSVTDSVVKVFTVNPARPVRIASNYATDYGGGMVIRDGATVTLWDAIVENNTSSAGGGAWLYSDVRKIPTLHMYTARDTSTQPPAGAVPCASGLVCNRVTGNVARPTGVGPGEGAAFWYGYDVPTCFPPGTCFWPHGTNGSADYKQVQFDRNQGDSLIRYSQVYNDFIIGQCLIFGNVVTGNLIETGSNVKLWLNQCTFSHNQVGKVLMRAPKLDLRCAIVNQAANTIHQGSSISAQFVLVPSSSQLPSNTSIFQGVPKFLNPAADNFRLFIGDRMSTPSPGLDIASDCGSTANALDLDGRSRPVDLGNVPNQFGTLDLGPYEARFESVPIGL